MVAIVLTVLAVLAWPGPGSPWGRGGPGGTVQTVRGLAWDRRGWAGLARGSVRRRGREELAASVEVVVMALRSGATPQAAVELACAHSGPVWSDRWEAAREHLRAGLGAAEVWRAAVDEGAEEARFLAGAWSLSERLGAPLAPALEVATDSMRSALAVQGRIGTASAGPRATMVMLTGLPVLGLLAGVSFGAWPWQVLSASPVAALSAGIGMLLTGFGWWLGSRILARAGREKAHR